MTKSFPKFASHEAAKCFSCSSPLHRPSDSGHAAGRGAFTGACKCGYLTWYDLKPSKKEIDVRKELERTLCKRDAEILAAALIAKPELLDCR